MNDRTIPRAGWKEWAGLGVLTLPVTLLTLDASVLFLAVPQLGVDLGPSGSQMLWILDIYGFMIAGFLVTMGTLGDRIGRRKLLMIGGVAFAVASVFAAFSTSAEMLIVARALLGIAGATLMPSTLALISNMFLDPSQRSFAIGVWMSSLTVGLIIGPLVGGILLEYFWWGSVFLLGVPVMVVLLIAAPILLPEFRDAEAGRLDLPSAALSLAAILPVIYGIKKLAESGVQALPIFAIAVGLVVGWIFVRRQRSLSDPLLDLGLFRNPAFSAALGIMGIGLGAMIGIEYFFAQYLQLVEGMSPFRAGLWLIPVALGTTFGSLLTPFIARRVHPAYIIAPGLALTAFGLFLLTQVQSTSGLFLLITGAVIAYVGLSPATVLGTDLVIGSAPPEKAGSASSLSETSQELGVSLGIAFLGSIGAAVYRGQVSIPADTTPEAANAARDGLSGAVAASEEMPAGLGSELLEAAREAFTVGLNTAAGISAIAMVVLAILAAVLLRHVRPSGETRADPEQHEANADVERMPRKVRYAETREQS